MSAYGQLINFSAGPPKAHSRRKSYCVMPNEISHEIIAESMSRLRHHFGNAEGVKGGAVVA
jgi:hypothetical protein